MYSYLPCNNLQNLAIFDLAIFEVTHPYSVTSKVDSPAVGLICGARPLAEVIKTQIKVSPSHFDVFAEDNMHILIVLPVRNHVENLSHILVEPLAVYQISVRAVGGGLLIVWQRLTTWLKVICSTFQKLILRVQNRIGSLWLREAKRLDC